MDSSTLDISSYQKKYHVDAHMKRIQLLEDLKCSKSLLIPIRILTPLRQGKPLSGFAQVLHEFSFNVCV